jgi:hypothetical protein
MQQSSSRQQQLDGEKCMQLVGQQQGTAVSGGAADTAAEQQQNQCLSRVCSS